MKDLFSQQGLQALRAFVAQPLLCLFDFDGTLAPLMADPDAVLLPPTVQARLRALQQRVPVGIVTGRSLADLRPRLDFVPDYLIGNHGLEGLPDLAAAAPAPAMVSPSELRAQVANWKMRLEAELAALDPGIRIEDKQYSLSLHYLHAQDPQQAEQLLRQRIETLQPEPRIIAGKHLFNVLPAGAGDKGSAVQALLAAADLRHALYVGDDLTDEDVFRLTQPGLFTVHVGESTTSAAQWRLHGQPEVERLLAWLVDALRPRTGAAAVSERR